MAVQPHPQDDEPPLRAVAASEALSEPLTAAHGADMDYFDPTGAHVAVQYAGTAPDGGYDYLVTRDGADQGIITLYPGGQYQTNIAGRIETGFTSLSQALDALLSVTAGAI